MTELPAGPESLFPPPPERLNDPSFLEKRLSYYNPTVFIDNNGKLKEEGKVLAKVIYRDLFELYSGNLAKMRDEIDESHKRLFEKNNTNGKQKRAYDKIFQSIKGKLDFEIGLTAAHVLSREKHEEKEIRLKREHLRTAFAEAAEAKKEFQLKYKDKDYLEVLVAMDKQIRESVSLENIAVQRRLETMITRYRYTPPKRLNLGGFLRKVFVGASMAVVVGSVVAAANKTEMNFSSMSVEAAEVAVDFAVSSRATEPAIVSVAVGAEKKVNQRISDKDAMRFGKLVQQKLNGAIPPSAVIAILDIESSMGANIGKAMGPAQITPETLEYVKRDFVKMIGRDPNPEDPEDAALLSGIVLKKYGWKTDNQKAMMQAVKRYGGFGNKQDSLESGKYWVRFSNQYQKWKAIAF